MVGDPKISAMESEFEAARAHVNEDGEVSGVGSEPIDYRSIVKSVWHSPTRNRRLAAAAMRWSRETGGSDEAMVQVLIQNGIIEESANPRDESSS